MIPKIIHFCWLSDDQYPEKIKKCIDSWKEKLPDYEIIKWDFTKIKKEDFPWVSQAYDAKKYAFAADYIRVYVLYHYGGIYLDSDVEVLKAFDNLLTMPYFIGKEPSKAGIEAATMGAEKGHPLFKDLLHYYNTRSFIKQDGNFDILSIPSIMRKLIDTKYEYNAISSPTEINNNLNQVCVLPVDYFSPKSFENGKLRITKNTYSIHHFSGTWLPWYFQREQQFWHKLGIKNLKISTRIVNLFTKGTIRSN